MPEPESRPVRLGAIVLAAGGSSRMGSSKQLLQLRGISLVARATDAALDSGARPVVVVVGADAEKVRAAVAGRPILAPLNPDWATGLASSIRVGISALLAADGTLDAVVVAPCDQPGLSAEVIGQLTDTHRSTGRIAAARYGGRNGAPAVFGRGHFATLSALSGDEGARRLLNADLRAVATVDLPALGADLDTPADVAAWLAAHS
jgi:molybdenum cofactor cytidylyltransferase